MWEQYSLNKLCTWIRTVEGNAFFRTVSPDMRLMCADPKIQFVDDERVIFNWSDDISNLRLVLTLSNVHENAGIEVNILSDGSGLVKYIEVYDPFGKSGDLPDLLSFSMPPVTRLD